MVKVDWPLNHAAMLLGYGSFVFLVPVLKILLPLRNTSSFLAPALHDHRKAWETEPLELRVQVLS